MAKPKKTRKAKEQVEEQVETTSTESQVEESSETTTTEPAFTFDPQSLVEPDMAELSEEVETVTPEAAAANSAYSSEQIDLFTKLIYDFIDKDLAEFFRIKLAFEEFANEALTKAKTHLDNNDQLTQNTNNVMNLQDSRYVDFNTKVRPVLPMLVARGKLTHGFVEDVNRAQAKLNEISVIMYALTDYTAEDEAGNQYDQRALHAKQIDNQLYNALLYAVEVQFNNVVLTLQRYREKDQLDGEAFEVYYNAFLTNAATHRDYFIFNEYDLGPFEDMVNVTEHVLSYYREMAESGRYNGHARDIG